MWRNFTEIKRFKTLHHKKFSSLQGAEIREPTEALTFQILTGQTNKENDDEKKATQTAEELAELAEALNYQAALVKPNRLSLYGNLAIYCARSVSFVATMNESQMFTFLSLLRVTSLLRS